MFNTVVCRGGVMGLVIQVKRCRACHLVPETRTHLLSPFDTYAVSVYRHRHHAALRVLFVVLNEYIWKIQNWRHTLNLEKRKR